MKKSLRNYYEKEAEHVSRYCSPAFWDSRYHNKRKKSIVSILGSYRNLGIFLDVGCGTGEYLIEVSKFCDEPIGLDISLAYLKRVKRMNRELTLVQADAQALPLRDKCIDYVLCSETIEHLQSIESALRELTRVAKKGLIISTVNYGFLRAAMTRISPVFVMKLDKSVGHINVIPLFQLHEKILRNRCKIKLEKTLHVIPPIAGEKLHLPKKLSPFFDICEFILEKLFPRSGNISLVECEAFSGC